LAPTNIPMKKLVQNINPSIAARRSFLPVLIDYRQNQEGLNGGSGKSDSDDATVGNH